MGWFRSPENRSNVRSLVRDWEEHNVLGRALDLARIGAFFIPTLSSLASRFTQSMQRALD